MKIVVTTDSTSDLPKKFVEKNNIGIMPLIVLLGEEEYFDGGDFTIDKIFQYVEKTGVLPKTAARSSVHYKEFFEDFMTKNNADALIHLSLSSELSCSYINAKAASDEMENVWVIDTKSLSSGCGLLALSCADKVNAGKEIDVVLKELEEEVDKTQASFIISNLRYLHKGGRCSSIAAFGANILMIKPKIKLKDGKMIMDKKYMGKYQTVVKKYVKELLNDYKDINKKRAFITYTSQDDELNIAIKKELKENGFEEVVANFAGATIASHCGEGCLGVLFQLN